MTPQQKLKTLILEQPEGSPIRMAYDRGDAECAAELNRKTIPAYIPRRHLLTVLLNYNLMPVIWKVTNTEKLPNGNPAPFSTVYSFCVNVKTVIDCHEDDLRTPIDEKLDAGCELFASIINEIPPNQITADQLKDKLVAKAGKISLYEKETELDAVVTPEEVAAVRAS